jgi:hypothetical protein
MKVAAAAAVETAAMVGAAAVAAMETASVINAACVAGAAIDAATIDASTIEASAVDASAVIPASAIIAAAAIIGVAAIAIAVGVVRRDVAGCRVNARRLASRERHCESRDDRAEKNPTATHAASPCVDDRGPRSAAAELRPVGGGGRTFPPSPPTALTLW